MKYKSIALYTTSVFIVLHSLIIHPAFATGNHINGVETGNHSPVTIFQGVTFNLGTKAGQKKFFAAFKEFIEQNHELKKDFDKLYGKIDTIGNGVKDIVSQLAKLTANNATPTEIHIKLQKALQAKENAEQTLEELKTTFKDELIVKNLIIQAETAFQKGQIDTFYKLMDDAIALKKTLTGQALGQMYYSKAQGAITRFDYHQTLKDLKNAVTQDPENALYLEQAGLLAKILGQYDKAIEYHKKALDIRHNTLDHSDVASNYYAIALNNDALGFIHHTKGEFDKAIEYYNQTIKYHKESLKIRLKTPRDNPLAISDSHSGIGVAYYHKKEYDKAIKYHNKSLNIRLKTLGEDHPSVANSYNNLGDASLDKGDYDKVIEYYNKSLAIMPKTLGAEQHPDVAQSYNGIGYAYNAKGEHDKAINYLDKALEIRLEIFKDDHPSVANSYTNLGEAYYGKKDYAKAEDYHNKAFIVFSKIFGANHPDTQNTKQGLALVKQAQNAP